jgi:hypothetical protein
MVAPDGPGRGQTGWYRVVSERPSPLCERALFVASRPLSTIDHQLPTDD